MNENETINDIAAWLCGIADNMESAAKRIDRERLERETCRIHPRCNRHAELMREAGDMRNLADRIKAAHEREVLKAAEAST